jgi:hypothetical protein
MSDILFYDGCDGIASNETDAIKQEKDLEQAEVFRYFAAFAASIAAS